MRRPGRRAIAKLHAWSVLAAGGVLGDDDRAVGRAVQPAAGAGLDESGAARTSALARRAKALTSSRAAVGFLAAGADAPAGICQVEDGWVDRQSVAELRAMN